MFRCGKFFGAIVAILLVAGLLIWGKQFPSYVKTSARAVQKSVQEQVPIEFELRRARDMIENILPELQGQVRRIAEEEVAINALEKDIRQSQDRLAGEQKTLSSLRNQMRVQQVSYRIGSREVSRNQLTEQMARRFDRFKQGELTLSSKQRLLEKRQSGLAAALNTLDTMRQRKAELEQKVEMLAAQSQSLKASQIQAGMSIDGSELSDADQLLSEIETRLAVAGRVLEHKDDLYEIDLTEQVVDEEKVLLEFDRYFDEDEQAGDSQRTMVVQQNES